MLITEIIDEDVGRRGFLRGFAGVAGTAAAAAGIGAGMGNLDKAGMESDRDEREFLSKIDDPADLERYQKLKDKVSNKLSQAGSKPGSAYHSMYLAKDPELSALRSELLKKYNGGYMQPSPKTVSVPPEVWKKHVSSAENPNALKQRKYTDIGKNPR